MATNCKDMDMELTKESREAICGKKLLAQMPDDIHIKIVYPKVKHTKGGRRTIAWVIVKDRAYYGSSVCSEEDMFCKKVGRKLAIIRACRKYWELNKHTRSGIACVTE